MKRQTVLRIAASLAFAVLALGGMVHAQSPREQFQQMVEQLQKAPNDNALREKIIRLAAEFKPAPAIPEEAERRMARGAAAFKSATPAADYQDAVKEFEQATLAAPWYGDAYFNLGVAQDKAGNYEAALRSLKLAQLASTDSKEIKALIYEVEFRTEKANSPEARAASQKQHDEELVRSLDGVRFDCPEISGRASGTEERDERWLVIKGSQLMGWMKVIQADPDLARARPQSYSLGTVRYWVGEPITGAMARRGGPNWEETFRIRSDRVVIDYKLDGSENGSITCSRR